MAALADEFQHQIAAERIADEHDSVAHEIGGQRAQRRGEIIGLAGVVAPAGGRARGLRASEIEAQHGPALADEIARGGDAVPARFGAGEPMRENDQRRAALRRRPVEPRGEPVAVGHGEQQPLAAGKLRRPADDDVAQRLQIAAEPRGPLSEGGKGWLRRGPDVHASFCSMNENARISTAKRAAQFKADFRAVRHVFYDTFINYKGQWLELRRAPTVESRVPARSK
jgi:hypothetical protein